MSNGIYCLNLDIALNRQTSPAEMKRLLLAIFLFSIYSQVYGQDPRFSQFNASPLVINPAMTGVYDGTFRVTSSYRDQWSSILGSVPFKTFSVGAEYKYNVNENDFFGVGVSFLNDEVGIASLQQTKGHLSASYVKQLSGGGYNSTSHHVGVGVQVGGGQNSLDWGRLWFSRQFDPTTQKVDTDGIESGETIQNSSDLYLDFNAGLLWYAIKGNNSVYAGGAMHHINSPVISFFEDETQQLFSRYIGQLGAQIMMNRSLDLLPSVLYMQQGPSTEMVVGSAVRYDGGDSNEIALRLGGYVRMANKLDSGMLLDALIIAANFEVSGINVGISYDINVSSLNLATNSRGAAEITISYINPGETSRRRSRTMVNPRF